MLPKVTHSSCPDVNQQHDKEKLSANVKKAEKEQKPRKIMLLTHLFTNIIAMKRFTVTVYSLQFSKTSNPLNCLLRIFSVT